MRARFATAVISVLAALLSTAEAYYNPQQGRWLSRDPIGEHGDENLYAFVGNHPLDTWDWLGLQSGYAYIGHVLFAAPMTPKHEFQWRMGGDLLKQRIGERYKSSGAGRCCKIAIFHMVSSRQFADSAATADNVFLTGHGHLQALYRPEVLDDDGKFFDLGRARRWQERERASGNLVDERDYRPMYPRVVFADGPHNLGELLMSRDIKQRKIYEKAMSENPNDAYLGPPKNLYGWGDKGVFLYVCYDGRVAGKAQYGVVKVIPRYNADQPVETVNGVVHLIADVLNILKGRGCEIVEVE